MNMIQMTEKENQLDNQPQWTQLQLKLKHLKSRRLRCENSSLVFILKQKTAFYQQFDQANPERWVDSCLQHYLKCHLKDHLNVIDQIGTIRSMMSQYEAVTDREIRNYKVLAEEHHKQMSKKSRLKAMLAPLRQDLQDLRMDLLMLSHGYHQHLEFIQYAQRSVQSQQIYFATKSQSFDESNKDLAARWRQVNQNCVGKLKEAAAFERRVLEEIAREKESMDDRLAEMRGVCQGLGKKVEGLEMELLIERQCRAARDRQHLALVKQLHLLQRQPSARPQQFSDTY